MVIDYQKICEDIFQDLPPRKKIVLEKRFGLSSKEPLTLQAIGDEIGITRERVRQIENDAFNWLKERQKRRLEKPFQYLSDYLGKYGGLREETKLLNDLGGDGLQGYVLFFLNLGDDFRKFKETEEFYPFWTIRVESFRQAKAAIENIIKEFQRTNAPLPLEEVGQRITFNLEIPVLISYIDISKFIFQSPFGYYGLVSWPEIRPRGLKDQAYLVLKRENRPLHFTEIAKLIEGLPSVSKKILPESVHNELIRNERFVLVGRGTYALREWGYQPGTVKEIIAETLKKSRRPLSREEITKKVLEQRQVKEGTILLNLQDKSLFEKDDKGRYSLKRG